VNAGVLAESASWLWRHRAIYRLSWGSFDTTVRAIAQRVRSGGEPVDCVLGISRGGLVPAVALSNLLGDSPLHVVSVARNVGAGQYLDKQPPAMSWFSDLSALGDQRVLVVDDVAGTGETLDFVRVQLAGVAASILTAVVVRMGRGTSSVDFVGVELDDWVLFPWEAKDLPPGAEVRDVVLRQQEVDRS
jgi:uncharacterized protein